MSSNEFQVVKKSRKIRTHPQSGEDQVISSTQMQSFGTTRTGGKANFSISSQGVSVSGKRELNPDAGSFGEDRNQFSGRGSASGIAKNQFSTSAQGFGYSSNTNGSRHSGNEEVVTKTTKTYNRFGHSGAEGMQITASETRTLGRGRSSQNSREGSTERGSQGGLQMSSRGRKIKIESEQVAVPIGSSHERRGIKIESEQVNVPTASNERRRMKIESEQVTVPTASNERRRMKIESEQVTVPTASNERRRMKIESEQKKKR